MSAGAHHPSRLVPHDHWSLFTGHWSVSPRDPGGAGNTYSSLNADSTLHGSVTPAVLGRGAQTGGNSIIQDGLCPAYGKHCALSHQGYGEKNCVTAGNIRRTLRANASSRWRNDSGLADLVRLRITLSERTSRLEDATSGAQWPRTPHGPRCSPCTSSGPALVPLGRHHRQRRNHTETAHTAPEP